MSETEDSPASNDKSASVPALAWAVSGAVCAASVLAGGFFGWLASIAYEPMNRGPQDAPPDFEYWVGLCSGMLSGLIVALAWCRLMVRCAMRSSPADLQAEGRRLGVIAGCVSTLLMHSALILAEAVFKSVDWDIGILPLFGLLLGLPVGFAVGGIGGSLYGLAFTGPEGKLT